MTVEPHKTAIIYCRVSSKEQVDNTSLQHQERVCREYAEREGLRIAHAPFVDEGESAKTADRHEFNRAISFCQKHKNIGFFIVYKLDRFARNQEDHVVIRAMLKRAGTTLRSATEPINDSPTGRAMEGMVSVFAEFDNNVRTERTKNGMIERVKQGVWVWPCPLGYHRVSRGVNISPDPAAPLIRLAFEEYAKGVYTYRTLAEFLTARGLRSRHGLTLGPQQVEKMLRNKIYAGVIEAWDKEYDGTFEPMVTTDLYDKCQRVKNRGLSHGSPRALNNPDYPLRGAVACNECHRPLTGSASTGRDGKRYPYYHHHRQGCSKAASIPKSTLEQLFVEHLEAITPNPELEPLIKAIVTDVWKENYKTLDTRNGSLRREIQQLEQQRQRVFELHRDGRYNDDEFTEQKSIINRRIDEKKLLMDDTYADGMDMESALDHCFSFVRNASKEWLKSDYHGKIQLQRAIFTGPVDFDGQRFGNTKLSLIYQLNREPGVSREGLVDRGGASSNLDRRAELPDPGALLR